MEIQEVLNNEPKRGRGRPTKGSPPIVKAPKKPNGRPKKYEEGAVAHLYPTIRVNRKRLQELLLIEKKYNQIMEIQKIGK